MHRVAIHVNIDPAGTLSLPQLRAAIAALSSAGLDVIATDLARFPRPDREIQLLLIGDDVAELKAVAERACAAAVGRFKVEPRIDAVTLMSSGSAEDAIWILRAFALNEKVTDLRFVGDDSAIISFAPGALQDVALGSLQTALEAALNRDVELRE